MSIQANEHVFMILRPVCIVDRCVLLCLFISFTLSALWCRLSLIFFPVLLSFSFLRFISLVPSFVDVEATLLCPSHCFHVLVHALLY